MQKKTENYSGDIPRTPIRFFITMSRPYVFWVVISSIFVILAASTSVGMRLLIEQLVEGIESMTYDTVIFWGLMYPVFFFASSILWRISGVTGREWLLGAPKKTTDTLTDYVSKHSHTYFSNRFAGSVSNKISNVSRAMEEFVPLFLWNYLEQSVPVLITGFIFLYTDKTVGLLFFGLIFSSLILNILLLPRKRNYSLELASAQSKTTGFIVDILSNVQAVRQYVSHVSEQDQTKERTEDVRKRGSVSFLYSEYMMFANSLLFTVFAVFMFNIMLDRWVTGEITSGRLLSFILLITYTSSTVIFLGRIISQTAKLYGRAEEGLCEIMVDHEIIDVVAAEKLMTNGGSITFSDMTFAYDEQTIFDNLNLTIKPGERIGLVGPSGAGKSTLVSLLLRQHDLTSGAILIDDQNIAEVTQDSLRSNIALVPQEPMLFHRTIAENIKYGKPDAAYDEMVEAAECAQARVFIEALPQQYDTLVGERGVKLSGGQKQRVAIARAMLKEAPILVLDEATSALDSESEVAIQKALESLMEGKTVIAVAHRLSTLRKMDRILVIDKGEIVEDGTHDTLANAGGLYATLWAHQAGGFIK